MAKKAKSTTTPGKSPEELKMDALRALTEMYDQVTHAAEVAINEGWKAEAEVLEHWSQALDDCVDELRAAILREWVLDSADQIEKIEKDAADVKDSIDDLKNDAKNAQTVIKIAGYIDDAIKIAFKLIA